jgi:tRNA(Arg) A34 adenosine deaminase TadA
MGCLDKTSTMFARSLKGINVSGARRRFFVSKMSQSGSQDGGVSSERGATPPTVVVTGDGPLDGFETFGWEPLASKTDDENLMDLTLIVTRGQAKKLNQGSMACLLVRGEEERQQPLSPDDASRQSLMNSIVCVANNMPLYSENGSDIHAEIYAIGKAVRRGIALDRCTAYITMPPCKRCFPALYSAGIRRIVSNKQADRAICAAAERHGIVMDVVASDRTRVDELVRAHDVCKSCPTVTAGDAANKKQRTK